MGAKVWTTKEISYIKRYALLAETNQVLNAREMAKKLGRSLKSVEMKIYKMQQDNQLPKVNRTNSFDSKNRIFSSSEDKRIISMISQQASYKEIGDSLDRTASSIEGRVRRLIDSGKIEKTTMPKRHWSDEEIEKLLKNIEFDENGYVFNINELSSLLKRTYRQTQSKIHRLRKDGVITVPADLNKASVKSKQAMNRFNEIRFASLGKEKQKMPEKAQANVKVEVQSQMIQVIMTKVVTGNEQTISYFTTEGELLELRKEVANVTH